MKHFEYVSQVLERVAEHNGTSVEEVRQEISRAIEIGMRNPDSTIQKKWAEIPSEGDIPTADELICYVMRETVLRAEAGVDASVFSWMCPDEVEGESIG